ncbi:MAG: hypothetical protein L3J16_05085, partial [Anaerolineales bacterium]|nr:hypothetical protein [Anaerolineales bacterium]
RILQHCLSQNADCVKMWSVTTGEKFSHIYISQGNTPLAVTLRSSALYTMVYQNDGVVIFERKNLP